MPNFETPPAATASSESPRVQKIRETKIDLNERGIALDAMERAGRVTGRDIGALQEAVQESGSLISDEERDALQIAINGVTAMRDTKDKSATAMRYAGHIEDIALASRAVHKLSSISPVQRAIDLLLDVVETFASSKEAERAGHIVTGTDEEALQKRREDLSRINVS